jgi:hypothetical protein
MCPSGRGLVVASYVPFWWGVCRQLCALLVGGWWLAVMCLSGRVYVVDSCVPYW